jgi:hypothetical protein
MACCCSARVIQQQGMAGIFQSLLMRSDNDCWIKSKFNPITCSQVRLKLSGLVQQNQIKTLHYKLFEVLIQRDHA